MVRGAEFKSLISTNDTKQPLKEVQKNYNEVRNTAFPQFSAVKSYKGQFLLSCMLIFNFVTFPSNEPIILSQISVYIYCHSLDKMTAGARNKVNDTNDILEEHSGSKG